MHAASSAGTGFLLAVLWFDLMFDVQHVRDRGTPSEATLASIAGYYRRVTTEARPMNRLVAAVMVATLACLLVQVARGDDPTWAAWVTLVLVAGPVGLAATRTVSMAVRLGTRADAIEHQQHLARRILTHHVACFASVLVALVVQLST